MSGIVASKYVQWDPSTYGDFSKGNLGLYVDRDVRGDPTVTTSGRVLDRDYPSSELIGFVKESFSAGAGSSLSLEQKVHLNFRVRQLQAGIEGHNKQIDADLWTTVIHVILLILTFGIFSFRDTQKLGTLSFDDLPLLKATTEELLEERLPAFFLLSPKGKENLVNPFATPGNLRFAEYLGRIFDGRMDQAKALVDFSKFVIGDIDRPAGRRAMGGQLVVADFKQLNPTEQKELMQILGFSGDGDYFTRLQESLGRCSAFASAQLPLSLIKVEEGNMRHLIALEKTISCVGNSVRYVKEAGSPSAQAFARVFSLVHELVQEVPEALNYWLVTYFDAVMSPPQEYSAVVSWTAQDLKQDVCKRLWWNHIDALQPADQEKFLQAVGFLTDQNRDLIRGIRASTLYKRDIYLGWLTEEHALFKTVLVQLLTQPTEFLNTLPDMPLEQFAFLFGINEGHKRWEALAQQPGFREAVQKISPENSDKIVCHSMGIPAPGSAVPWVGFKFVDDGSIFSLLSKEQWAGLSAEGIKRVIGNLPPQGLAYAVRLRFSSNNGPQSFSITEKEFLQLPGFLQLRENIRLEAEASSN